MTKSSDFLFCTPNSHLDLMSPRLSNRLLSFISSRYMWKIGLSDKAMYRREILLFKVSKN